MLSLESCLPKPFLLDFSSRNRGHQFWLAGHFQPTQEITLLPFFFFVLPMTILNNVDINILTIHIAQHSLFLWCLVAGPPPFNIRCGGTFNTKMNEKVIFIRWRNMKYLQNMYKWKRITWGLTPIFPKQKWAKILIWCVDSEYVNQKSGH